LPSLALLLAANSRTGNYFTGTCPDMDSIFLATLALIVIYYGAIIARHGGRCGRDSGRIAQHQCRRTSALFGHLAFDELGDRADAVKPREWEGWLANYRMHLQL
jgi:hypothetical protein